VGSTRRPDHRLISKYLHRWFRCARRRRGAEWPVADLATGYGKPFFRRAFVHLYFHFLLYFLLEGIDWFLNIWHDDRIYYEYYLDGQRTSLYQWPYGRQSHARRGALVKRRAEDAVVAVRRRVDDHAEPPIRGSIVTRADRDMCRLTEMRGLWVAGLDEACAACSVGPTGARVSNPWALPRRGSSWCPRRS